jgi:hypothetical protein
MDSLLGYLTPRFATQPENLATESLNYIISRSTAASRSLVSFIQNLGVSTPETLVFRTQATGTDGCIPDLVGSDVDGKQLIILEVKFWAPLTENQPVLYLKRLPAELPAALVFIAPAARLTLLWSELLLRCRDAKIGLGAEREISSEVRSRSVGDRHVLAIASWRTLISHLLQRLNLEADGAAVADMIQLQGLCARMDDDAFLPLHSEELSSSIAARLMQFCRLIDDVVTRLVVEGRVSIAGVRASGSAGSYFRSMKISEYGCSLEVNADFWHKRRATPIWLRVKDPGWKPARLVRDILSPLGLTDPPRVLDADDALLVPIRLPTGVERQEVLDDVFAQVLEVAALLEAARRPDSAVP